MPTTSGKRRHIDSDFQKLARLGHGSYGTVYKVRDRKTANVVALKKVKLNVAEEKGVPSSSLREIAALKNLKHPNVLELFDIIHTETNLYLVFEYLDEDLKKHLDNTQSGLQETVARCYLWQLLKAISYCHSRNFLHRDLKLQNILVNSKGVIKLADFGLARTINLPVRQLTQEVVTLWYRAPEILLGSQYYGPAVDIWSLGCIYFELLTKRVLFRGTSEIDQLFKIFQILGTPNATTLPDCEQLSNFKTTFPQWPGKNLNSLSPVLTDAVIRLLTAMFVYDPFKRISAKNAMMHPYFDSLRKQMTLRNIPNPN